MADFTSEGASQFHTVYGSLQGIVSMQVINIINAGQFSTIICRRAMIITLST